MARQAFQAELDDLRGRVLDVGTRTRTAVDDGMAALHIADTEASQRITTQTVAITRDRWTIEERTIVSVAEQSPVASDRRLLTGFLAMLNDLGRISDHARDICEINALLLTGAREKAR